MDDNDNGQRWRSRDNAGYCIRALLAEHQKSKEIYGASIEALRSTRINDALKIRTASQRVRESNNLETHENIPS